MELKNSFYVCVWFMVKPESPFTGLYAVRHMMLTLQGLLPGRDPSPSVLPWISHREVDISCSSVDDSCCAACRQVLMSPVVLCVFSVFVILVWNSHKCNILLRRSWLFLITWHTWRKAVSTLCSWSVDYTLQIRFTQYTNQRGIQ